MKDEYEKEKDLLLTKLEDKEKNGNMRRSSKMPSLLSIPLINNNNNNNINNNHNNNNINH